MKSGILKFWEKLLESFPDQWIAKKKNVSFCLQKTQVLFNFRKKKKTELVDETIIKFKQNKLK